MGWRCRRMRTRPSGRCGPPVSVGGRIPSESVKAARSGVYVGAIAADAGGAGGGGLGRWRGLAACAARGGRCLDFGRRGGGLPRLAAHRRVGAAQSVQLGLWCGPNSDRLGQGAAPAGVDGGSGRFGGTEAAGAVGRATGRGRAQALGVGWPRRQWETGCAWHYLLRVEIAADRAECGRVW